MSFDKLRALEEGGLGFRIQISNRHGIQDSNFKQGGIQDSDFSLPVCCAFEICILYIRHDFGVSWFSEICILVYQTRWYRALKILLL